MYLEKKMSKDKSLLVNCLQLYDMNLTQFSEHTGISRATMDGWMVRNRISSQGVVLLTLLQENKILKSENIQLKEKVGRYDKIFHDGLKEGASSV